MSLNQVTIIGNLGADPELKTFDSGNAVCELRVAVNETWKSKDGEKQEHTEWFRVKAWGGLGETCSKFLSKGRQVCVTGKMRTSEYEKDGQKHYAVDLIADNVRFLGGKGDAPSGSGGGGSVPDDDVPF